MNSRFGIIVTFLIVALGSVLVLFLANRVEISGSEFNPQRFSKQDFVVLGNSLLGIGRSSTRMGPAALVCSPKISKYLDESARPPGPTQDGNRWDLIRYTDTKGEMILDQAAVLIDMLDFRDALGNEVWLDWTEKNPQAAAVFWPRVQQLAIQKAYFAIPDFMESCLVDPDPKGIEQRYSKLVVEAAIDLASDAVKRQSWSDAEEYVAWGASFSPSETLESLRTKIPQKEIPE